MKNGRVKVFYIVILDTMIFISTWISSRCICHGTAVGRVGTALHL